MKTPTLDKLIADTDADGQELKWWDRGDNTVENAGAEVHAAVAEDMRLACEKAWAEGFHAAVQDYLSKTKQHNPYARKDQP